MFGLRDLQNIVDLTLQASLRRHHHRGSSDAEFLREIALLAGGSGAAVYFTSPSSASPSAWNLARGYCWDQADHQSYLNLVAGRSCVPAADAHPMSNCSAVESGSWFYLYTRPKIDSRGSSLLACKRRAAPFSPKQSALLLIGHHLHSTLTWPVRFPSQPVAVNGRAGQVLADLQNGYSEKQIANRLGLSPHTVHVHVKNIYRKFRVGSRAELLSLWITPNIGKSSPDEFTAINRNHHGTVLDRTTR